MPAISQSTNRTKKNFIVAITPDSVILICMRIEKDHLNIDDNVGAEQAMEACMEAISEILMLPALDEDKISEGEATILALVGGVLKTISKKAQAYEDVYEKGISPQNSQN